MYVRAAAHFVASRVSDFVVLRERSLREESEKDPSPIDRTDVELAERVSVPTGGS